MADEAGEETEQAEAREYLAQVLKELRAREGRLARLDNDIAQLGFELEQCGVERLVRAGDVRTLLAADAYREKLRAQIKRKRDERKDALEDVARARERKVMAEEEMQVAEGEET